MRDSSALIFVGGIALVCFDHPFIGIILIIYALLQFIRYPQ